jgi:uncharacterized damage-inducible protein DinB
MATLRYIQRLFSYDDWANREILTALQKLEVPPPRSVRFLAHIVAAERLWLERLRLQKQTYPVWPDFNLEQCKLEVVELPKLWKAYLATLKDDGLSRSLTYKNSKGESWTSQKHDILMHVILHSAYHRGQIATDMRAAAFTPAYTDFIHAVRQELLE